MTKTHGIKTATTLFTKQMFKSQVKVKRYSLTIIFLITGKSMEISKDGSMDKTLLYLLKLTLTLW